eukprot:XP_011683369.1 PREDICTED: ankyrin repeat domain-containing protein 50-like [Strongylocentrotus purpuratus]
MASHSFTKGADLEMKGPKGQTPLSVASLNGQFEVVKHLINEGAELDTGDKDGCGSQEGHLAIVECPTNEGANVDKASNRGHHDVVQYLIAEGANVNTGGNTGFTPLNIASRNGHLSVVECLVNAGADVNKASGSTGGTPLYAASQGGHLEVVECAS